MADHGLHAVPAQGHDATSLGQREGERLLERDGLDPVPHSELDQVEPDGGWGGEAEHVRLLGGEHGIGVGVSAGDAKLGREGAESRVILIAERHQLEAIRIREEAKGMALSASPAADEHGAVPMHPGILLQPGWRASGVASGVRSHIVTFVGL